MIRYCTKCLYPDTKPDLRFDENGVCSACNAYEQRESVNWDKRRKKFAELVQEYRSADGLNHDCVVPVSGGKDSTYQVVRILEQGLNPLCVTATTDSLSAIGRRNLDNIKELGVDLVEVTLNPRTRRKINRLALREIGDISWPEHTAIFTIPVRVAVGNSIRLIIWGENPQNEYGGPAAAQENKVLDRQWLEEFGGLLGFRVSDLIGQEDIRSNDLIQYRYPSDEDLQRVGVTGIFLGHYFPWDGLMNAIIAQGHGFETLGTPVEGSLANYENLDNHQTGIHDYFKYLKFGFSRATDLACNHIRRGRLSRADGLNLVRRHDGAFPWTCLGRPIEQTLREIGMTIDEFHKICDRFTTKKLFQRNADGSFVRDEGHRLIKINDDNI